MKLLPAVAFATALALAPSLLAAGESVQQILSDAQTAYLRGDMVTAKRNFQIVTQLDPKNVIAQNYLRMIVMQEAKAPRGNDIEKSLSTVILPKIELREATLGSAFDVLKQQVTKLSEGKKNVNFVIQVPDDRLQSQPVTLQLTSVPFTEALRYLCDLAGLSFEYQPYAIKITAKGAAPAASSAPAATTNTPAPPAVPGL